jgi:hypothetical protein
MQGGILVELTGSAYLSTWGNGVGVGLVIKFLDGTHLACVRCSNALDDNKNSLRLRSVVSEAQLSQAGFQAISKELPPESWKASKLEISQRFQSCPKVFT